MLVRIKVDLNPFSVQNLNHYQKKRSIINCYLYSECPKKSGKFIFLFSIMIFFSFSQYPLYVRRFLECESVYYYFSVKMMKVIDNMDQRGSWPSDGLIFSFSISHYDYHVVQATVLSTAGPLDCAYVSYNEVSDLNARVSYGTAPVSCRHCKQDAGRHTLGFPRDFLAKGVLCI